MAKTALSTHNNVSMLCPGGFGFGKGAITVKKQLDDDSLSYSALLIGSEIIENDARVFKKVDTKATDDGCGDGREAKVIYRLRDGQKNTYNRSLLRAKIFGGGLVVFTSMMRAAVWGAELDGQTILGDRKKAADVLHRQNIAHGGHTDNHASGDNCGCGAIDKYVDITANALTFRDNIEAVLETVFGEDFPLYKQAIDDVLGVYQAQVDKNDYFADAGGVKTRQLLEESGAVVKELADAHLEDFVVINDVEGETFDQRQFDAILKARGVETTAQAFVVDLWRGRMYARLAAKEAAQNGQDKGTVFKKAFADFLVRTLATSATLTAGDQPVFYRAASRSAFLKPLQLLRRR